MRPEVLRGRHVVVVTPVSLDADSRTRKQVMSLLRWGAQVTVLAAGQVVPDNNLVANRGTRASTVVVPAKSRPKWIADAWAWVRQTKTPAIFLLPVFGAWLVHFSWRTFVGAYRKIPRRADLYILHEFGHFPAVARAAGDRPIIYDAHDFYTAIEPEEQTGSFDRHLLTPFNKRLERRCVARADAVLTVSPGLARLYSDAYGKTPVVVRNCHDDRLDASGVTGLRARLRLSAEKFVIVIVGNWKAGQEFDPLLRILGSGHENVHLALVGSGYHRLEPAINSLKLKGRVHRLGRMPPAEIVPLLTGANVAAVVYYARSENYRRALPNGFFQSVAAGLPVLYPNLPEIRAIAEQGDFGLMVDWSNEADIAAAIETISEQTRRFDQLRANAEKAALALSWEKEERVLASVLSACLESAEPAEAGSATNS